MARERPIIFCGGGSGGHVFPLLAVFEQLPPALQRRVIWWGSAHGIERRLVPAAGLPYRVTPCGKLRRYFSWRTGPDLLLAGLGVFYCFFVFLLRRPVLVLSKGGYVSLPVALAAGLLRVPVLTHESDFSPGVATRLIARVARRLLLGWPESVAFFPASWAGRLQVVGNPVRAQFYQGNASAAQAHWQFQPDKPLLLVLGGSLGAEELNLLVAAHLPALLQRFHVLHQHGAGWRPAQGGPEYGRCYQAALAAQAGGKPYGYMPVEFIAQGMADLMAASGLILARSGAGFLSELLAAARPALLLPLTSSSSRGEQRRNAESFAQRGLAEILRPEEQDHLTTRLEELWDRREPIVARLRQVHTGVRPALVIAGLLEEFLLSAKA